MKLLAVDPGESTGWATFTKDTPLNEVPGIEAGTVDLWEFIRAFAAAVGVMCTWAPTQHDPELAHYFHGVDHVAIEDWALYPWELQNLGWDKCRTARGIGAIQFICECAAVPYTLQPASIKDAAEGLGAEESFYRPLHENRHQNDAIRHGVYWLATHPQGASANG